MNEGAGKPPNSNDGGARSAAPTDGGYAGGQTDTKASKDTSLSFLSSLTYEFERKSGASFHDCTALRRLQNLYKVSFLSGSIPYLDTIVTILTGLKKKIPKFRANNRMFMRRTHLKKLDKNALAW